MAPATQPTKKVDYQLIQHYLKVFRELRYGVLDQTLKLRPEELTGDEVVVLEAPRFHGDLKPLSPPVSFRFDVETPWRLRNYYHQTEAFVYQRFEELQVANIFNLLGALVWSVHLNETKTEAHVIFASEALAAHSKGDYRLDALDLKQFVHDLIDFGEIRADYFNRLDFRITFRNIVETIRQHPDCGFKSLGWSIITSPWAIGLEEDRGFLIIRSSTGNKSHDHRFTNDTDGAANFILFLLDALMQRSARDFMHRPS